jgi:hypothetical protein
MRPNPYHRKIRLTLTYDEWLIVTRAFYLADRHKPADIRVAEWAMACVERKDVHDKIVAVLAPYVPREGS